MNLNRLLLLSVLILFISIGNIITLSAQPIKLSEKDSLRLRNLPELPVSDTYWQNKFSLPLVVDNSTLVFWRGIFWQSGCSCGQAASEGYVFTYEMSRARNLNASLHENRYPYSFTYNFLNEGNQVCGASFLESMDIIRMAGNPTLVDNHGVMTDSPMRKWLNGYSHYYAAMHNRINQVYAIHVGTPEGLEKLKHYLHNHLDGSTSGGMAFFYANHVDYPEIIPAGTPEAGKHLITEFSNTSHSMTIVGYNDQVRFDFNNDGVYTNHLDLNNDGVVDMKDWEIGAIKIANSYSGGISGGPTQWADQGFAYVPYRLLAYHNGPGIWDKAAYVVDVKEEYEPLLTAKVSISYNSRNKIKVSVGVSSNQYASWPDKIKDFPHFRFQGDALHMQGGTSEADKTIEFGLDISDLLNFVDPGSPRKFFLLIEEVDPNNVGNGTVHSFKLIDYTQGGLEVNSTQANISIVNNGITLLGAILTPNLSLPEILNDTLPSVVFNSPYQAQLEASGGTEPYRWFPFYNYKITEQSHSFVPFTGTTLSNSYLNASLDFEFPFYGKKYQVGTVSRYGALMFDAEAAAVPYSRDYSVLMRYFKSIAPFYGYHSSATIRYEGNQNFARFYWTATFDGINLQYMITLFPDGTIYIDYGNNANPTNREWQAGVSKGDQTNYQEFSFSGQSIPSNKRFIMEPQAFPEDLVLGIDGSITGIMNEDFAGDSVFVKLIDNNWLTQKKGFLFTRSGLLLSNYQVSTGALTHPEYGAVSKLSFDISNVGETNLNNIQLKLLQADPNYTVLDSLETLSTIAFGQTIQLLNAFEFEVAETIEDNTILSFVIQVNSTDIELFDTIQIVARAAKLILENVIYTDSTDSIFDAGDQGNMELVFRNIGGAKATNLNASFLPPIEFVSINSIAGNLYPSLAPDSNWSVNLNLTADINTPNAHIVELPTQLSGDLSIFEEFEIPIGIGKASEDWETGTLFYLPWASWGDTPWFTDNQVVFEGNYAIRSGIITHNESSFLSLACHVATAGEISFYKKVSSELNYDFLYFYIDNQLMGTWSGEIDWDFHSYPIQAGYHSFEWRYVKDYSVENGLDAAFIDFIQMPASDFLRPELFLSQNFIEKTMNPDKFAQDTLFISNIGGSILSFSASIDNSTIIPPAFNWYGSEKSIEGSLISVFPDYINTGMPVKLQLTVYNNSNDDEWLQEVRLSFPLGVILDSASNFIGGSQGELEWNEMNGNGVDVIWYGENIDGYGVIKGGETAIASLYLTIDPAIQNSILLLCELRGDEYGSEPHTFTEVLILTNLGLNTTWLSLENETSNVIAEEYHPIILKYNSYGIPFGDYSCTIEIESNDDTSQVNVLLHVVDPIVIQEFRNRINLYPNPARHKVYLELPQQGRFRLEVFSSTGELMFDETTSESLAEFDVNSWSAGIYWVIISSDENRWVEKIIVVPN